MIKRLVVRHNDATVVGGVLTSVKESIGKLLALSQGALDLLHVRLHSLTMISRRLALQF